MTEVGEPCGSSWELAPEGCGEPVPPRPGNQSPAQHQPIPYLEEVRTPKASLVGEYGYASYFACPVLLLFVCVSYFVFVQLFLGLRYALLLSRLFCVSDVIITMPALMAKLGKLGKVLGPRGLMPNPKSGTVTNEIGKAIKDVKAGKIDFKVDKFGIIHTSIGKVSFDSKMINENALELLNFIQKLKPSSAKGIYVKSVSLSSTMSSSIKIDSSVLID